MALVDIPSRSTVFGSGELVNNIFSFFDDRDLACSIGVCRFWNKRFYEVILNQIQTIAKKNQIIRGLLHEHPEIKTEECIKNKTIKIVNALNLQSALNSKLEDLFNNPQRPLTEPCISLDKIVKDSYTLQSVICCNIKDLPLNCPIFKKYCLAHIEPSSSPECLRAHELYLIYLVQNFKNIDINKVSKETEFLLRNNIYELDEPSVESILKKVDIDEDRSNIYPRLLTAKAITSDRPEIIRKIINRPGISFNYINKYNLNYWLRLAIFQDHIDMFRILLQAGRSDSDDSSPHTRGPGLDYNNNHILHSLIVSKNIPLLREFFENPINRQLDEGYHVFLGYTYYSSGSFNPDPKGLHQILVNVVQEADYDLLQILLNELGINIPTRVLIHLLEYNNAINEYLQLKVKPHEINPKYFHPDTDIIRLDTKSINAINHPVNRGYIHFYLDQKIRFQEGIEVPIPEPAEEKLDDAFVEAPAAAAPAAPPPRYRHFSARSRDSSRRTS